MIIKRIQLAVTYNDHAVMYYAVPENQGWRIDNPSRCLIIGRGIPRTYVPLDQVRSFDVMSWNERTHVEAVASNVDSGR